MRLIGNMRLGCAAVCMAAAIHAPTLAQSADDAQSSEAQANDTGGVIMMRVTEGDPIVVTGQRPIKRDELRDVVREIAMRGRSAKRPMSQFQAPLCAHVTGLGDQFNDRVTDRIYQNTREAGFVVAPPGCETNAMVVVVKDPDALIKALRKSQPRLFNVRVSRAIKAARNRGDVAIAWAVNQLSGVRGRKLDSVATAPGTAGTALFDNAGGSVPQTQSSGTSRHKIPYSLEKVYSIIIFDVERLNGVHLDQLADFATMRLLASPQPEVVIESERVESILTLFDGNPLDAPEGLTQVDRAFLKGLYDLRPNDPATRLEGYVAAAYQDIRAQDCASGKGAICPDYETNN